VVLEHLLAAEYSAQLLRERRRFLGLIEELQLALELLLGMSGGEKVTRAWAGRIGRRARRGTQQV
jgi:hypothetical protein